MQKYRPWSEKGFTLVELLIGVAVLSILMAGVFGVLSSSLSSFRYLFTQNRNIEDARQAINALSDELRYAKSITTGPADGATLSLGAGNSFVYVVSVNGGDVTRTLTRDATSKTVTLQGGTAAGYPVYSFGTGIVTALTVQRTDDTTHQKVKFTISITANDTSQAGGSPVTTSVDVIPNNLKPY